MLSGGRRRRGGGASAAGGAGAARSRVGSGARRGGEVRGQMPEVVVVYGCRLAAAWRPFIIGEGDWAEGGRRRPGGEGEPPSCLCPCCWGRV